MGPKQLHYNFLIYLRGCKEKLSLRALMVHPLAFGVFVLLFAVRFGGDWLSASFFSLTAPLDILRRYSL